MPVGLFVAIYAKEITHVLLGPKWIAATVFLRIFGIATFLEPALETSWGVMLTYGLSRRLLVLSLAYNALFVALMLAGIPWGAEGVALANVAIIVLTMFPVLYFALRQTPVTVTAFFRAITTPAIASASMVGVLLGFRDLISRQGMTVSLFSGLGVGAATYAAVVFLLPHGRRQVMGLISAVLGSFHRHRPAGVTPEESEKLDLGATP
jgi:PST family polysaccharide transporter